MYGSMIFIILIFSAIIALNILLPFALLPLWNFHYVFICIFDCVLEALKLYFSSFFCSVCLSEWKNLSCSVFKFTDFFLLSALFCSFYFSVVLSTSEFLCGQLQKFVLSDILSLVR